jgi:MFS family permease
MVSPKPRVQEPPNHPGILLFVVCLNLFFMTSIFSALNVALPIIGKEFHADNVLLGWVSSIGLLTSVVILLPVGRLSDILGLKKVFTIGMIIYTLTCLAGVFSSSVEMLIAVRGIQGLCIALVVGNGTAMISNAFPSGERGRALGTSTAFVYIGLSVGPLIGGILSDPHSFLNVFVVDHFQTVFNGFFVSHLGWRNIFVMNIPAGLIVILLLLWKTKGEWRGARGERFDVGGSLIFALAVTLLMYGFTVLASPTGAILVPLGILGLVAFVFWESWQSSPIINIGLLGRNRTFAFSNLAALISYAATFAVVYILSFYLQDIKGFSAEHASWILLAQPAVQAVVSPLAGRFSDRVDARIVSSMGMALTCLGLAILAFLSSSTSTLLIIAVLMVLGIGFGLFVSPNTNAVMGSVDPKVFGMASAMINTMRQIGQMFSIGVVLVVQGFFMGRVEITPQVFPAFVTSSRIAFLIFAVLCLAGVFASLARGVLRPIPK